MTTLAFISVTLPFHTSPQRAKNASQRRSTAIFMSSRPKPNKRLCVLSDGTWNSPENPEPSNIVKLTENIRMTDDEGIPQIVFYDAGVGTGGGSDRFMGGAFGAGIDLNIKQMYTFLSHNYEEGDEVYMFGFSRGAYTVRSLAGFIHECGLCRRNSLEQVEEAYELYRDNLGIDSPELRKFRAANGERIPIELVLCFETVGSLGVPHTMRWLSDLTKSRYEFHDTKLSDIIRNAIHVMAIDEERAGFKPTFMKQNKAVENQLTQKFLWGTHGGIGGSEETEKEEGEAALSFAIDEMKRRQIGLAFHDDIIENYPDMGIDKVITAGKLGFNKVLDSIVGKSIRPIEDVSDVHHSAIERFQVNKKWRPDSLKKIGNDLLSVDLSKINSNP